MLKMVDISHHQSSLNARQMASQGITDAYPRAMHGAVGEDRCFAAFAQQLRTAGIRVGTYDFCAWHFECYNKSSIDKARELMRKEMQQLIRILDGKGITGWVALDQEQEPNYGRIMNLGRSVNTQLLNEAAEILREAGYSPCLYVGANWCLQYVDAARLQMPIWVAWYYVNPDDPDFSGCADFHRLSGKYAQLLKDLESMGKLCAWQFGRIGHGAKYGVASANIDRDWLYRQPENNQNKEITMEDFNPSVGKQLVVTRAEKPACEAFVRPDINSKAIKLAVGTYPIIGIGPKQMIGGVEAPWYMIDGNYPYVAALPDRCRVEDAPKPKPEPKPVEPKPTGKVQASLLITGDPEDLTKILQMIQEA